MLVAQSEPQTSATHLGVSYLQHGFLFFLEVSDTASLILAYCLLSFFSGALSKRLLFPRFHGGTDPKIQHSILLVQSSVPPQSLLSFLRSDDRGAYLTSTANDRSKPAVDIGIKRLAQGNRC